jgi:hypothetical protein
MQEDGTPTMKILCDVCSSSPPAQAEDVRGKVIDLVAAQLEIGHPTMRRLQEGSKGQRRRRLHARNGSECRRSIAGTMLLRLDDHVAAAAPALGQMATRGDVTDVLRGHMGWWASQQNSSQQWESDEPRSTLTDLAVVHRSLRIAPMLKFPPPSPRGH